MPSSASAEHDALRDLIGLYHDEKSPPKPKHAIAALQLVSKLAAEGNAEMQLVAAQAMAAQGLRVLAVARRSLGENPAGQPADAVETDMVLLGLVGLADPPRPQAMAAVAAQGKARR